MPGLFAPAAIIAALWLGGPGQLPGQDMSAQPANDPATWVTIGDYPAEALAKGQSGAVAFRLEVDAAGNIVSCRVTASSGAPALDRATCALLFLRARFTPASDATGQAVAGGFASRIKWVFPADYKSAAPIEPVELRGIQREGEGASVLKVDEQGIITACDPASRIYDNVAPPPDICHLFPVGTRYAPPGVTNGKPVKRKITLILAIRDVNVR